jgi:hypothetical protein
MIFGAFGLPLEAWSKVQVGPASVGELNGVSIKSGGTISNAPLLGSGGTFFYFVSNNGTNPINSSKGFIQFNPLNLSLSGLRLPLDTNLQNVLQLSFYSNVNLNVPSGQQAVVTVQLVQPSGGTVKYAPIASVNGTACNDSICYARVDGSSTTPIYYAARYPIPLSTLDIGVYPRDLCQDYYTGTTPGGTIQGCTQSVDATSSPYNLVLPVSGTPTLLALGFSVFIIPNAEVHTQIPTNVTATDSNSGYPFNLSLGIDTPSLTCPPANSDALNSNSYKPSDSQILLNTTNFGISGGSAPAASITVVAVEDSAQTGKLPNVTENFANSGNTLVQPVNFGAPGEPVKGFVNSETQGQHLYNVSLIVQDQSGVFAPPKPDASACLLAGVETVADQGFTKTGSGNCFIATAAFQSAESTPVLLLRKFRDRVLLQFELGDAFVSWYYRWSPSAAQWLNDHPLVRVPVLLVLAPLEGTAWLFLHPWVWALCFVTSLTGGLYWMKRLDRARTP